MIFRGLREHPSCGLRGCKRVSAKLRAWKMDLRFFGFFDDFLDFSLNY
jgi:hypothetical protein